jgi:hypothetical protein
MKNGLPDIVTLQSEFLFRPFLYYIPRPAVCENCLEPKTRTTWQRKPQSLTQWVSQRRVVHLEVVDSDVGSAGVTHDEDLGEVDDHARVEVVVQEHSTQIFLNQERDHSKNGLYRIRV